jgi:TonB family protein
MTRRPLIPAICRSILALTAMIAVAGVAAQQPETPQPPEPSQPALQQQSGPALLPAPSADPKSAVATPFVLSSAEQGKEAPAVNENELRQQLMGKTFYLRTGYLDNTLHFDEKGKLDGNSPKAPYTLSLVEITRVRLEKHKLQLEGVRYGLHFLGASATEDQTAAVDKVRLTTKKKPLVITVDREEVAKPKKEKEKKGKHPGPQSAGNAAQPQTAAPAPPADNPDGGSSRHHDVTESEATANRELALALDTLFATGIDDRMIATLPDYWKLFYRSNAEHRAYKPADAAVLRQGDVDRKAKLISAIDPPSNEFAQKNGVAGMAMYHVVVGTDGKAGEIAVGRPIGFGLDENAVKSIQQAKFEPAAKGGQPVPVVLNLVVQFRIYSKLTAEPANPAAAAAQAGAPILPGPYTANAPKPEPATDPQPAPADTTPSASPSDPPAPSPVPSDATQQPPASQPAPQQTAPQQQPPAAQPQ